ncbi:MAG: DUF502 domain-containing protein, partial [Pseudomonadales bacterium]|nr:DUF502 domain-containing protein [Pseudomonadales bacterium]
MSRFKSFLKITLLGGMGVLLPLAVFAFFIAWLFDLTTDLIQPLTNLVLRYVSLGEFTADALVILVLLAFCFVIGLIVKTGVGVWMHNHLDHVLVKLAPGYKTVKDIVQQFFGSDSKDSLMKGEVVRAWIYGRNTPVSVTGILTSRHANGDVTVY